MDYCSNFSANGFSDRISGLMFGHAIGDACGLITEYMEKKNVPKIEFPYTHSIRNVPVNDWTDDTDLMILTMVSLINNNMAFEPRDIANRFCEYLATGLKFCGDTKPTTPNNVFKHIVSNPRYPEDPIGVATDTFNDAKSSLESNSPLSRISILGATKDAVMLAENFCRVTHVDSRCIASCVFTVHFINSLIYTWYLTPAKIDDFVESAKIESKKYLLGTYAAEFDAAVTLGYTQSVSKFKLDELSKSSSVFKCLSCVLYAAHIIKTSLNSSKTPDFKKVIMKIVMEGGDADANGAVVGAVIGAFIGYKKIPQDWISAMPFEKKINQFTAYFISKLSYVTTKVENEEADTANNNSVNEDISSEVTNGVNADVSSEVTNDVNVDINAYNSVD